MELIPECRPQSADEKERLFGSFSLSQAVGYTDMEIRDRENRQIFLMQTEVFPQKLDYKEDFHSMVSEISEILYQLAFDFMKKTYSWVFPEETDHKSNQNEWLAMFSVLFKALDQSLNRIVQHPHKKVKTTEIIQPAHKVRRASHKTTSWLARHPQYLSKDPAAGIPVGAGMWATHLPDQQKRNSCDTPENRFVGWAVSKLIQQLAVTESELKENKRLANLSKQIQSQIRQWKNKLGRYLQEPVFAQISPYQAKQHFSPVLNMAAGYREFYHLYLLLQKGLRMSEEEIFRLDYKDISTLYEYWCFLKTIDILRQSPQYELESHELVVLEHDRFHVRLKKGESSRIDFRRKDTGELLSIWYNRAFSETETHTFTQIPDHFIEFEKKGYHTPFRFVLDAKYRFEMDASTRRIGPPADAIGQLHRYRDAILSQKQKRAGFTSAQKSLGGIILFPYPGEEEDFRTHRFYKSRKRGTYWSNSASARSRAETSAISGIPERVVCCQS